MKNDQPDPQQQVTPVEDIRRSTSGLDHSKITDHEEITALKAGTLVFIKLIQKKMAEEEKKRKAQEQETFI